MIDGAVRLLWSYQISFQSACLRLLFSVGSEKKKWNRTRGCENHMRKPKKKRFGWEQSEQSRRKIPGKSGLPKENKQHEDTKTHHHTPGQTQTSATVRLEYRSPPATPSLSAVHRSCLTVLFATYVYGMDRSTTLTLQHLHAPSNSSFF